MKNFEKDFAFDLEKTLEELNILSGDTLMLHSDSAVIGQYFPENKEDAFYKFFSIILNKLGSTGTLLVPAFSMSYTENKPYFVKESKSVTGPLSEYFRTKMPSKRSLDPIYSFSAIGKYEDNISKMSSNSCFGNDSVFSFCFEKYGKLLFMGCSLDRATFVHFVEEKLRVNYRYFKSFSGETYLANNDKRKTKISLYVRDLEIDSTPNHTNLEKELAKGSLLNSSKMNRLSCKSVKMSDFFEISKDLLDEDKYALINEKS